MKHIQLFILALMFSTLAACGGGDEGYGGNGGNGLSVSLSLRDQVTGQAITSISSTASGILQATITDGDTPQASTLVTFTTTLGTLDPPSGTALTDANGVASVLLSGDVVGAGTATAEIKIGDEVANGSANFRITNSIVTTTIDMGNGAGNTFVADVIDLGGVTTLSAGGTLTATVNIVDTSNANAPYTQQVDIDFESTCTKAGTASMDSPRTTANGAASSTYKASGCVGTDTITARASIGGTTYTAQANVTVESPIVGSIEFTSATPEVIALKGTGGSGLSETSTVVFTVKDQDGGVVPNQAVNFELSTSTGGITLSPLTATTNADGRVQTVVNSGTVNTSVRVTATVASTAISTQSVALAVSTGIPDNNSFEIAAETLNPSVWECNGGVVPITAFVADHFNNPAPNGTAVAFQTEGGLIDGSCTTANGQCTVNWISNAPRPTDGRVTILATVIGEEGFTDNNPSNGRFDDSESFTDLPEAWRDDDESGSRDANEEFLDFNSNGVYDLADGTYNGVLCAAGSTICNPDGDLVHARSSLTLVMASVNQEITLYETTSGSDALITSISLPNDGSIRTFRVDVQDARGQRPPAGTKISVATTNGSVEGGNTTEVLSSSLPEPSSLAFSMKGDTTPSQGALTITVDIPGSHCQGAVKTDFGGIIVDDSLDVTPPRVKSTTPTPAATGIAVDSSIIIEFSEAMDKTTVEVSTVTISDGTSTVTMDRFYDTNAKKLHLIPNSNLSNGVLYKVTIPSTAADLAKNTLEGGAYEFVFKTEPTP